MNIGPVAARKRIAYVLWTILAASATVGMAAASEPAPDGGEAQHQLPAAAGRCDSPSMGSPYIPVDSWIYPAVYRLYSLGFIDTVYLGMRPWTRTSVLHMLEETQDYVEDNWSDPDADQAREIYDSLMDELKFDVEGECGGRHARARLESAYTVFRGISGTPLRDSFHLGSTIVNDYGRPFEGGFNNYTGASGYATAGRFSFYARGEFQRAPSAMGYSTALAEALATIDETYGPNFNTQYYGQTTIPLGPIASTTQGRILEATVSANVANHEISFGKQDAWDGPAQGGAMAYSNNAENIYSFRINRVEPLHIPLLSRLTGPFRYEIMVGALQGHTLVPNPAYVSPSQTPNQPNVTNPGNPWVHVEKVSFRPTRSLEFGFSRTVVWGGKGHEPITIHSFLKSFFSVSNVSAAEKFGRNDPGARFSQADFSYRLPWRFRWITLYTDSEARDDIMSISAPRRAAWRPGIYMARLPGLPRLDLRVEGVMTDPPHSRSNAGQFMYWEYLDKQAYTNQGQLFGDWVGREDKGGQAWATWHLSGNEWVQVNYRHQKAAKDFIKSATAQYGTTLNDVGVQVVKRFGKDLEVNGNFTLEHYNAPIFEELNNMSGKQTVTNTSVQLTWYPGRKVSF